MSNEHIVLWIYTVGAERYNKAFALLEANMFGLQEPHNNPYNTIGYDPEQQQKLI